MSVLQVTNVRSNSTSFNTPVVFQTSGGTENGQLSRTWVNFNGQGTVAIRADFNVNTVGDNGTGDYTMNFSNAMTDANYCFTGMSGVSADGSSLLIGIGENASVSSGSLRFRTSNYSIGFNDHQYVCVSIFR
jgi:hypothetical protein